MSQEQKHFSSSSSSSTTTTHPQNNKDNKLAAPAFVLLKALPLGDVKVAALLKPVKTNITIKPRYRDTAFADEIFAEPYSCDTGDVYEWEQITYWLKTHNTSPKTNEQLESKKLRPAKDKQEDVQEFLDEHPELRNSEELYLPRHWVKELEQACEKGDIVTIKRLCDRDKRLLCWTFNFNKDEGLVNPTDYARWQGKNILHLACRTGKLDAIMQLVTLAEQRASGLALQLLLQADEAGLLPFHHAIVGKQSAQALLTLKGWMGDQLDKVGKPSFRYGVWDDDPLDEALTHCVLTQDLVGIHFFLRWGADRHAMKNRRGESLVYLAAKAGQLESLKVLLAAKADPNQRDARLDDTPLHAAVRAGHREVALLLKKHGANLAATLQDGSTVLHLAASTTPALITALCDDGGTLPVALREKPDAKGHTPLHRAILAGSLEMVKWFITQKISLTSSNKEGQNALHLAATGDQVEILQLLLEHGAALNVQDQTGNTALHLAAAAGSQTTLAALLRAGSATHLQNNASQAARQCAADRATAACYDAVAVTLREKEAEALKAQGQLGAMVLQQQELIRQLQAELQQQKTLLVEQQAEIEALRERFTKLAAEFALGVPPSSPQKSAHSSSGFGLFDEKKQSPAAQPAVAEKALGQLLKCVAEGEQGQAEALIKKEPKLLLAASKVTDLSGRTFDNITAFQYALWAMDYHMWTMIQKHLPAEAQAEQHQVLESKGTAHGKHYDLQPLLEALKIYLDNASKRNYEWEHDSNYDKRLGDQWSQKVGGAQRLLPVHVVNEYCRLDRPFNPCPAEWTSPLPRTQATNIFDGSIAVRGSWFAAPQLGVSFAFYRGFERGAKCEAGSWLNGGYYIDSLARSVAADFKSLQALWHARSQQLNFLSATLTQARIPNSSVVLK